VSLNNQYLAAIAPSSLLWTPHLLTNRALWLDATYEPSLTKVGSAIYSVGEEVGAWADRTANGVSVTQSASFDKPLYEATNSSYQINGKPAVVWNAASQSLASSAFVLGDATNNKTLPMQVYVVLQLDLPTAWTTFHVWDGLNNSNERWFARFSNGGNFIQVMTRNITETGDTVGAENNGSTVSVGSSPVMLEVVNNRHGNASSILLDGTEIIGAAFGDEGFDGLILGNWINRASTPLSLGGRMGEFLITSGTQTQADREKIEGYLAHKWGLTANLPAAHPYKTTAPFYES